VNLRFVVSSITTDASEIVGKILKE
jgi:hypothetical protein